MTLAETLARKLVELPAEQQLEVLDFVEFLQRKRALAGGSRRNPEGMLADVAPDLALEDFRQARREMWGDFPRELPDLRC